MKTLTSIAKKNKKIAIGLMSGTSADGVDAAVVQIEGSGYSTTFRLCAFITHPYPVGFKKFLLKVSDRATGRIDDIARADVLVAQFFADAARHAARTAGFSLNEIAFIGSHGQTIHHLPDSKRLFGKSVRSTLQIGNPSIIAKLTGVVTIGDFRTGDIALGGSGAPLVPVFDYLMLHSKTAHRAALNLGGIANITYVPKNSKPDNVIAFDTGPGNMIIDNLVRTYFGMEFDRDGRIATTGKLSTKLLRWMMSHPYLKLRPPKSTGRETFGEAFYRKLALHTRGISHKDIITTATEFTALSIFRAYAVFLRPLGRISELFVSGGGIHNRYIMEALTRYFSGVDVRSSDQINIPPDAKEAICFALLANETLSGHPGNIPSATGATHQTILGLIALP